MRYQWGPLLRDGGERRLNVAATRAKHRLTLVSSFSAHDVDPERLTKAGARLLADYLEYAGSGGTVQAAGGSADLSPFEADVRDRLADCGITVVPQYGVGGYRVDFAATHPDDADRMVLAIEADGASYRRSGSVRDRDRLRGEHLQRLGWSFHRIWSTNWFHDPQAEVAKLRRAYHDAVEAADAAHPPVGEPVAEPVSAPAAEPVSEPVAAPTAAPVTEPVAAPVGQHAPSAHAVTAGGWPDAEVRPAVPPALPAALPAATGSRGLPSADPTPDSTATDQSRRSTPGTA